MSEAKRRNSQETLADWVKLGLQTDRDIGPAPIVRLPADARVESLEPFLEKPVRIRTNARKFLDIESFEDYVKKFRLPETVMFEENDGSMIRVIFDYHVDPKTPGWCDHQVALISTFSPVFEQWKNVHGRTMHQEEFAEFLEMNSLGIVKPDAATVLEAARSLQAVQRVEFQSGVKTSNGDVQFTYAVNTQATAGQKGKLDVPEAFEICCPVFLGQGPTRISVRLFWRIGTDDKKLTFRVMIPQLKQLVDLAREAIRGQIEDETDIVVWRC